MTKTEEKPAPVFSCRCSQTCTAGASDWLSRAPLAECFANDKPCRCKCHAFAKESAASFKRWQQETGRERLWFAKI